MPYNLSIVRAGEFIRCGSQGTLDFEESRRILLSLADAIVRRGAEKAVLDVRKSRVEPQLTFTQLYELARTFQQSGFGPKHRLALLIDSNRYDRAEFFAHCASGPSWNCYAFDSFEEALEWLVDTEELPKS